MVVELEIDNHLVGLSIIAQRELERLYGQHESMPKSIDQWYKWFGCNTFTDLLDYFLNEGTSWGNIFNDHYLGQEWNRLRRPRIRNERCGQGPIPLTKDFTDGVYRMTTQAQATETSHVVEGRSTSPTFSAGAAKHLYIIETTFTPTQKHRTAPLDLQSVTVV